MGMRNLKIVVFCCYSCIICQTKPILFPKAMGVQLMYLIIINNVKKPRNQAGIRTHSPSCLVSCNQLSHGDTCSVSCCFFSLFLNIVVHPTSALQAHLHTRVSGSWIFCQTKPGQQPRLGLVEESRTTDFRLGLLYNKDGKFWQLWTYLTNWSTHTTRLHFTLQYFSAFWVKYSNIYWVCQVPHMAVFNYLTHLMYTCDIQHPLEK